MSQFKFFLLLIVFLMALAACSPPRAPEVHQMASRSCSRGLLVAR
ncbi:hypothetical protein [Meiothermus sp.]